MLSLKFYFLSIIIILCANFLKAQDSTDGISEYTTAERTTYSTTSTTSIPTSTTSIPTSTTAESTTYTTTSTTSIPTSTTSIPTSTTSIPTSTTSIPTSTTSIPISTTSIPISTTSSTTSTTAESTTYTTTSTTSSTTSTTAESTTFTTTSTTSTIPILGTDSTTIDTTTVELNTNDYTSYYEVGNFTDFFYLNESTISNDYNETYDHSTTIDFGNETMTFSNESTTYELTTKTSTTTTKPIILGTSEYKFNSSIVIVWEKCGLDARTKVTQIFKSIYSTHQLIYSYDPSINVIISEEITLNSTTPIRQVLKIPNNINGELIFFVFNEPGKV